MRPVKQAIHPTVGAVVTDAVACAMLLALGSGLEAAEHARQEAPTQTSPNPAPRVLATGDYLLTSYRDALIRSEHPGDANPGPTAYFARVTEADGGDLDVAVGTFHDGEMELLLHAEGSTTLVYPKDAGITFKLLDPHRFSVRRKGTRRSLVFEHVEDVGRWLASTWFGGRYVGDGDSYVFGADGFVEFSGRRVPYTLEWDDQDVAPDLLVIGERRLAFERTPTILLLREVDSDGRVDPTKTLRLRRTGASP